jgi:hypothetical protein
MKEKQSAKKTNGASKPSGKPAKAKSKDGRLGPGQAHDHHPHGGGDSAEHAPSKGGDGRLRLPTPSQHQRIPHDSLRITKAFPVLVEEIGTSINLVIMSPLHVPPGVVAENLKVAARILARDLDVADHDAEVIACSLPVLALLLSGEALGEVEKVSLECLSFDDANIVLGGDHDLRLSHLVVGGDEKGESR